MTARAGTSCPDELDLVRAATNPASPALAAHLAGCRSCRRELDSQREIVALGRELPIVRPTARRLQDVRASVLNAVQPPAASASQPSAEPSPPSGRRRGGWLPPTLVSVVAAAAVFLVAANFRQQNTPAERSTAAEPGRGATLPPPRPPAELHGAPGARFARRSGPPHETVMLERGALRVSVQPAQHGETFKVLTARGEVEVRGTIFETTADERGLRAVVVERGRVMVRPAPGAAEVVLVAGQSWQSAEPAAAPRSGHARSNVRSPTGRRSTAAADPADSAFGEGLARLRAGDPRAAAVAFDRALALSPSSALAEDVWYWRAVALGRAGRGPEARQALESYLERHPLAPRAAEASVMLGQLLLDAGEAARAESRFRAGLHDRSARVRQAARAGLDAVAKLSPAPR